MAEMDAVTRGKLQEVFAMLDVDDHHAIASKDVSRLLNKLLGREIDDLTVAEIIAELTDSDSSSNEMEPEQFYKAMASVFKDSTPEERTKRAFGIMDKDGSGTVDVSELAPLMSAVAGQKLKAAEVEDVLKYAAPNGKLTLADYARATSEK